MNQQKVTVKILGREYQFAASDDERASLLSAADYLDSLMRGIKGNNSSLPPEKVSIMAALNISHELIQMRENQDKINQMQSSLENILKQA